MLLTVPGDDDEKMYREWQHAIDRMEHLTCRPAEETLCTPPGVPRWLPLKVECRRILANYVTDWHHSGNYRPLQALTHITSFYADEALLEQMRTNGFERGEKATQLYIEAYAELRESATIGSEERQHV